MTALASLFPSAQIQSLVERQQVYGRIHYTSIMWQVRYYDVLSNLEKSWRRVHSGKEQEWWMWG